MNFCIKKIDIIVLILLISPLSRALPIIKYNDPLPANAFIELAKLINPAVVNISTTTVQKNRGRMGNMNQDPFFEMFQQFYGIPMMPNTQPIQALGTGFVIREDGLIITNNHVIAGADIINVQLSENTKQFFEAKVIGSDERTDIALIKIDPKIKLPTAQLGISKELEVGEWVAAFGNPFGNGHTITKGIISALGRDINEINKFPLIQTDTPINPGNSGGPLVNLKGQVIGVNSAIQAQAQGIGFAIPIDEVKNIIPQLEKNGHLKKPFLGVALADLDPRAALQLGLKSSAGAIVVKVEKGSPAAIAGLQIYDVITEFNEKKVETAYGLTDAISDSEIGSKVKLKITREGREKTLFATISEKSKSLNPQKSPKYIGEVAPNNLGFTLTNSSPNVRKDFQIEDEYKDFPVVVNVTAQSKAENCGLEPGDIILEVNKKRVFKIEDVFKNIKKGTNTLRVAKKDSITILFLDN